MKTNCENCGATLTLDGFEDRLTCRYCDTVHVPSLRELELVEVSDGVVSSTCCPLCATKLSRARVDQWNLLCCLDCAGLLIKSSDLLKIIMYSRAKSATTQRAPDAIDPASTERDIDCSGCGEQMESHPYFGPGDFVIDSCKQCEQVWLDGGELQRSSTVRWGGSLWR